MIFVSVYTGASFIPIDGIKNKFIKIDKIPNTSNFVSHTCFRSVFLFFINLNKLTKMQNFIRLNCLIIKIENY